MSEIKAAGPAPPVALPVTGSNAPTATQAAQATIPPLPHGAPAVNLAGALGQLADGSRLSGIVIGQNAAGEPLLATDRGLFSLSTDLALPQNTRLLLQVFSTADGIEGLVLMLNGKAVRPPPSLILRPAEAASGLPPLPANAEPASPPAAAPAVLIDRARFTATVLAPPASKGSAADHVPPTHLAPGSRLMLRLLAAGAGAVKSPVPARKPSTPAPALSVLPAKPDTPGAASALASSHPETALAPETAAANPSDAILAPIIDAPNAALVPAARPGAGARLDGAVTGEAQGRVLLETAAGLIAIDMPAELPPGTNLSFEILSLGTPGLLPDPALQSLADPLRDLAQSWPALRQAFDALRQIDPAVAAAFAARTLPRPDVQLASSLLFFLAAARGASARAWLGEADTARLEDRGGDALLRRLDADLKQIGQMAETPGASGWQALPIPLYDGQAIVQVMLYTRHQSRPGQGEGEDRSGRSVEPASRFVLELTLSATGPVQIDGLAQATSLDLIIRTRRPLAPSMQRDIRTLFHDGLTATRTRGSLHYQVVARFPLAPLEEIAARATTAALVV